MSKHKYSISIYGSSNDGKSSLVNRICLDNYFSTIPTIGVDYKLTKCSRGRKSDGLILIYDITNMNSFISLKNLWIPKINEAIDLISTPAKLIGNKKDLKNDQQVTKQQGDELAQEYSMRFYEASVLSGEQVNQAFQALVQDIYLKKKFQNQMERSSKISLKKEENKKQVMRNGHSGGVDLKQIYLQVLLQFYCIPDGNQIIKYQFLNQQLKKDLLIQILKMFEFLEYFGLR